MWISISGFTPSKTILSISLTYTPWDFLRNLVNSKNQHVNTVSVRSGASQS